MSATVLYRIAAVLLVLFAAGHTLGFLRFCAGLSIAYLFLLPAILSAVVVICLAEAAWLLRSGAT